jgi:osmotically-inducible protein OsmY
MSTRHRVFQIAVPLAVLTLGASAGLVLAAETDASADAAITAKVQAALASDRRLEVRDPLEVRTRNGVVELIGEAESASMVYRAVETARNVDGVKEVDSHRLDAP